MSVKKLKKELLKLTIEYIKKHLNSSNLEQRKLLNNINLIISVLETNKNPIREHLVFESIEDFYKDMVIWKRIANNK